MKWYAKREPINRDVLRRDSRYEPTDPPPSSSERSSPSLVASLAKKLGPFIMLGTVAGTVGGWFFAAGQKTSQFVTDTELKTDRSANEAVRQSLASQISSLSERTTSCERRLEAAEKNADRLEKDIRELRSTSGVRVTASPNGKH